MVFNYKKLIGFGILIWVVAFIVASILIVLNLLDNPLAKLIIVIAVGLASFFCGRKLGVSKIKEALSYSAIWVVIGVILDMLITVRFAGWTIFMQWDVLLGYLLILTVPLVAIKK